jgi:uncharacterized integral membrane protein
MSAQCPKCQSRLKASDRLCAMDVCPKCGAPIILKGAIVLWLLVSFTVYFCAPIFVQLLFKTVSITLITAFFLAAVLWGFRYHLVILFSRFYPVKVMTSKPSDTELEMIPLRAREKVRSAFAVKA